MKTRRLRRQGKSVFSRSLTALEASGACQRLCDTDNETAHFMHVKMVTDSYISVSEHNEKQQILQDSPRPPRANGSHRNEASALADREEEGGADEDMAFCMMLMRKKVHYFPVFTWFFIIASFFICYGIAVYNNHVEPDFPYISYTAIESPERCYFAQLVNFGACLLAGNVFLRFLQMREVLAWYTTRDPAHRRLNIATLVVGFLSALGFSMVANFQTVVMRPLHYTGAGLAFVFGLCYCWMSSALTWQQRILMKNRCVAIMQILNSTILTIFLVLFGVTKAIYKYRETHGMGTKWDSLRTVYLLSTSTEWLTATLIVTFVLTLYSDFKKIRFYGPRVKFMRQPGEMGFTMNGTPVNGRPDIALNAMETPCHNRSNTA